MTPEQLRSSLNDFVQKHDAHNTKVKSQVSILKDTAQLLNAEIGKLTYPSSTLVDLGKSISDKLEALSILSPVVPPKE